MRISVEDVKRDKYVESLYDYGILSLTYLLTQYENEQNYEECAIIVSAIEEHNRTLNDNLPTTLKESIEFVSKKEIGGKDFVKHSLASLPHLAKQIKKSIR